MAKIRKVVLKKTELATYRGLGMTNAELAAKFEVKPSEINDALIAFGMKKGTPKEYQIELVNDFDNGTEATVEEPTAETAES